MEKVKTSISIDKDVYDKIKELGEKEDRSFSQQINKILKDYLKSTEK
ncbi:MAG TPA: toxin-antitoxin system protein [Clostridiaceae bacterium]